MMQQWRKKSGASSGPVHSCAKLRILRRRLFTEALEPRLALAAEIEPNNTLAQATTFGTADEILTGRISNLADRDYFQVSLAQGDRLRATYDKVGTFDPEIIGGLELLDDAGRVLSTKVANIGADLLAPKAGTYYVRTAPRNDYGEFTGVYSIGTLVDSFSGTTEAEPNDTTGTATAATSGSNFRGAISSASDLDYYSFTGAIGQIVSIDLVNVPADSPTVIVYRPDGTELGRGDTGTGVQFSLTVAGSYRFVISAVRSVGTFTGQYVGRMSLATAAVTIPAVGTGFDSAVPVTFGATPTPIVGRLTDVNVPRYFSFGVTSLHHTFVSIVSLPMAVKLTVFNERGQPLEYRHGEALFTQSADYGFTAGRYFVAVQALSEAGLGPFHLSVGRSTSLSPQRDVPLYFIDFDMQQPSHIGYAWVAPFAVPAAKGFVQGIFESRYDSWDVDVTQTMPPAGTEHVAQGYGEFGPTGVGGRGGGGFGTRRPSGDGFSDVGTTSWTNISYDYTDTLIHEYAHSTGLLHARSVQNVLAYQNDDQVFPVGSSYIFPGTDSYVPSTFQYNPRDYLDWALQAGRQIIELEPNDAPAAAVNLDLFLNEMRAETANGAQISTGATTRPMDLRLANLNGDAWPDLVVAHDITETLTVHLGTGLGTFAAGTSYTPGFDLDWFDLVLAIGDLNGDSRDDVLIAGFASTNNVAIYLANANGTLAAPTLITAGSFPDRITLSDLNNDTRLDLITGNGSQVGIHLGNGNGTFQTRTTVTVGGSGVRDLVVANVNGDAHVDIITANNGGDNVSILRGNGNGTFLPHVSYAVGDGPMSVLLQELTGDSNADLVTINFNSQTISVLPGTGGGVFGAAVTYPGVPDMYSLSKGEFNLDGKVDLVVSTNTGVRFFTTNASNAIVEFSSLTSTLNKAAVVADLNQDGRDDLLWGNYWNTRVDVVLSRPNDVRNDRAVVFGRIDSATDVDVYTFTAAAGQRFAIDVEAAEFQYPVDAVLSVYDNVGNLVVQSDDALDRDTGVTSVDPYLSHTFAAAGTYQVRVTSKLGTAGHYRLKLTPGEAIDDDGPRVLGTWPAGLSSAKTRRQIILYMNDQLDPATLTAANIVVQGNTSGVRTGTVFFDPLESVLIWTADANLPSTDTYTVTLAGGANGIKDLKGNQLDGETDGTFVFPEVSGNGTPGGDFSFTFTVNANDTTPATISASYTRGSYNRGRFFLSASDELSMEQIAGAQLTARGAGPDATFNTADDRILPLDVLQDGMNHRNSLVAFTRGIPDPDQYRIEGAIRDNAGFTINLSNVVNVATEVPESALFTSAALTQTGLVGSYVNSSLRSYAPQDDWRTTQTIVGTRTDPTIDFATGDFGLRSEVGVTGGSDTNWDNFSTQWDGYLQVPAAGTRLLLRSNHGSRMWIDINNDGIYGTSGAEFFSNGWGTTGSTTGTLSTAIAAAGAYRVRIQFEHGTGSSQQVFLEWLTPDFAGRTEGIGHGPSVIDTSIQAGSVLAAGGVDSIDVTFSGAINPATLTAANVKLRYSADPRFYNGDDSYLTEANGVISWNAAQHKATFQSSQALQNGYYLLELNGDAGGIADNAGNLLDGEFLTSYIAGNAMLNHWQDSPSGDGIAGGDHVAAFSISNFSVTVAVAPASVAEDGAGNLVYTFTRTGDVSTAATVNFAVTGDAAFSTDYSQIGAATFSSTAGTVTFAAGATTATVTIDPTADAVLELDETVGLTIMAGTGYNIGATMTATGTIQNDEPLTFQVTTLTPTPSGVVLDFNRDLDVATLNLYDVEGSPLGPADVTLVGASVGSIRGSLVVDPNLRRVTFLRTTGILPPDTYTLTLRSAANGFRDTTMTQLDGDANGTEGGNYVQTFTVTAPPVNAVTVSLPNIARGPQQGVNVPANGTSGLPLSFSDGAGITSATLEVRYDPALLQITTASVALGLPAGASVTLNTSTPGIALVQFTSATPLAAGTTRFVDLQTSVPISATYRSKHVLDIANVSLNGGAIPALADDALHVVAYFGDATGNGTYSAQDASRTSRLAVGLDGGLQPFKMLDPTILADITGNGAMSAADTSRLLQVSVGISVAEIPTLPFPAVSIVQGGPDPKLSIPTNLVASAGGSLTVPVLIDSIVDLTGNGLESADLVIYYDAAVLNVTQASLGSLLRAAPGNWMIAAGIDPLAGRVIVSLAGTQPLEGFFAGELVHLQATIRSDAPLGAAAINLAAGSRDPARYTQLNEGYLTLIPAPTDGARDDGVDGRVTIVGLTMPPTTSQPRAILAGTQLVISGTDERDHFMIGRINADRLRVRAGSRILGDFPATSQIVLQGIDASDVVSLGAGISLSGDMQDHPTPTSSATLQDLALLQWLESQTARSYSNKLSRIQRGLGPSVRS